MGLDGVEIVIKVEDAFSITIEDDEAGKIATPGQLIDLVLSKVGRTVDEACLTKLAFHRVRAALMRRMGVSRNKIRPDILLGSLFPRSTRREDVRQISGEIGLRKEIEFVRPAWVTGPIMAGIFVGGFFTAIFVYCHPVTSHNLFLNIVLVPLPIVAAGLFVTIFGWVAVVATNSTRIEFQSSVATIGDLSRWIVVNAPDVVKAQPGQWSREQVSEIVREIVIDILGCNKEYREDAHFIKDLGMG
jgi:acyl carrier protein